MKILRRFAKFGLKPVELFLPETAGLLFECGVPGRPSVAQEVIQVDEFEPLYSTE